VCVCVRRERERERGRERVLRICPFESVLDDTVLNSELIISNYILFQFKLLISNYSISHINRNVIT
jgi:hypothetical protein